MTIYTLILDSKLHFTKVNFILFWKLKINMELKKEFLRLLREDVEFRNEVEFLLNIDEIERELQSYRDAELKRLETRE